MISLLEIMDDIVINNKTIELFCLSVQTSFKHYSYVGSSNYLNLMFDTLVFQGQCCSSLYFL